MKKEKKKTIWYFDTSAFAKKEEAKFGSQVLLFDLNPKKMSRRREKKKEEKNKLDVK